MSTNDKQIGNKYTVLKFGHHCFFDPEGADRSRIREFCNLMFIMLLMLVLSANMTADLKRKKTIPTPLVIEKPVRSPMLPPMRFSWTSVLIFLSLSISSKVAVPKKISTNWSVEGGSSSPIDCYL